MMLFKPHLDHKHIDKSVRGKWNRLFVGTELALDELLHCQQRTMLNSRETPQIPSILISL